MIKELIHDPIFLAGKSEVATKEDLQVAQDLLDTLMAHRESCVGMAANMIGVRKRIIVCEKDENRIKFVNDHTEPLIIHTYPLSKIEEAYELFENKRNGVIKVAVEC